MNATIRKATLPDIPRLVELHSSVFNTNTNYLLLLGRGFLRHYFQWCCTASDAFVFVAEGESGIAGYVAVNQGSYYRAFRVNWHHALLGFLKHPTVILHPSFGRRFKALLRARAEPADKSTLRACVSYIALDPAMNVRGIGPVLMKAALDECRSRGWYEVVTAIHANNVRARSLGVIMGFESYTEPDADGLASLRIDLDPKSKASAQSGGGTEPQRDRAAEEQRPIESLSPETPNSELDLSTTCFELQGL